MTTPDFDDLLGRLRGLVIALGPVLVQGDVAEVDELLDHAELGEGLRTLAWLIVEEDKRIEMRHVREIESLAARMHITAELPGALRRHGVAGH